MACLGGLFVQMAAHAQVLSQSPTDEMPPPPFGVRDENGVFSRDPDALRRISDAVRKLKEERGFQIYIVVEPVLIGVHAQEWAAQLHEKWLPEGNGLVVIYERDSRQVGVSRNMLENWESDALQVPPYETVAILSRVMGSMDVTLDSTAFLESMITKLVAEFEGFFTRLEAPAVGGRSLRMGLLIAGLVCLTGLAGLGLALVMRGGGKDEEKVMRFPAVDVPERLGAPYGGGSVIARRFREPGGK